MCMKNILEQKVYYADTDAYGVVWHGAYLRWLEMGRVELCEDMGYDLVMLKENNIVLPVVNINVRYKSSAKLNDELIIETSVQKFNSLSVTFDQKILNKETGKIFVEAVVDVVAINNDGKLYRRMPQILVNAFEEAIKVKEYAVK
jgi:acyl-CoA thioester hydrolase